MCKAGVTKDLQNVGIGESGEYDSRDYESRDYESHPSSPADEKLDELAGKKQFYWSLNYLSLFSTCILASGSTDW